MTDRCVVCRHRDAHVVCTEDRHRAAQMLTALPRRIAALPLLLVPGRSAPGDRVSTTVVEARMPVRADTLTLIGPGSDVTAHLHPLVRHWATQRTVTVHVTVAGRRRAQQVTLTEWHNELVLDGDGKPVLVTNGDQVGVLPPVEWLDQWTRNWRRDLGHSVGPRTRRADPAAGYPTRAAMYRAMADTDPADSPAVAAMIAQWRTETARVALGLNTHHRGDDPLADEWEIRWGEPDRYHAYVANTRYLMTWLDEACDRDLDIAAFFAELRALHAELGRVLGEQPDDEWIGRCPALIEDPDDGTTRPCGAGLWKDPYIGTYSNGHMIGVGRVECPRCHSAWTTPTEITALAQQIRRVWPVDRRRRYTTDDIDRLAAPKCRSCTQPVIIEWRDVTATTDRTRWWQPAGSSCPNNCEEARRAV